MQSKIEQLLFDTRAGKYPKPQAQFVEDILTLMWRRWRQERNRTGQNDA